MYILTSEDLSLLYKSGCRALLFGLESYSRKLLQLMNKKTNTEEIMEIYRQCRSIGIQIHSYVIIGTPYETWDDIEKTILFLASYTDTVSSDLLILPSSLRFGHAKFHFPKRPSFLQDVHPILAEVYYRNICRIYFKTGDGVSRIMRIIRKETMYTTLSKLIKPKILFPLNSLQISPSYVPRKNRIQIVGDTVITVNKKILRLEESGIKCLLEMDGKTVLELSRLMKIHFPREYPTEKDAFEETRKFIMESDIWRNWG